MPIKMVFYLEYIACVKPEIRLSKIIGHSGPILVRAAEKELIARQIGKMVNCREPKIISGPGKKI